MKKVSISIIAAMVFVLSVSCNGNNKNTVSEKEQPQDSIPESVLDEPEPEPEIVKTVCFTGIAKTEYDRDWWDGTVLSQRDYTMEIELKGEGNVKIVCHEKTTDAKTKKSSNAVYWTNEGIWYDDYLLRGDTQVPFIKMEITNDIGETDYWYLTSDKKRVYTTFDDDDAYDHLRTGTNKYGHEIIDIKTFTK